MPSNKTTNNKPRRYLPDDYVPHENDVMIGRGRRVEQHNQKFRAMISAHLAAYYNAQTKATKSTIILRIFQQVKRGGGTGFIKLEAATKKWFAIEDAAARISVAQAFRDALASEYKSSKQYKQQKRKEERGEVLPGETTFPAPPTLLMTTLQRSMSAPVSSSSGGGTMSLGLPPPRLLPVVSSDGRDLTRPSLQAILDRASNVINEEEFLRSSPDQVGAVVSMPTLSASVSLGATVSMPTLSASASLGAAVSMPTLPTFLEATIPEERSCRSEESAAFSSLFNAFGTQETLDPFEPTPLKETNSNISNNNSYAADSLLWDDEVTGDLMASVQNSLAVATLGTAAAASSPKRDDTLSSATSDVEEDVFNIFDNVPALDMKTALTA